MRNFLVAASVMAASLACGARGSTLPSANWLNAGYGPQHTGLNPAEHTLTPSNVSGLQKAWSFTTQGAITVQPVEANGKLFALSGDGNLYALSAQTGTQLWQAQVNNYYAMGLAANSRLVFSTCAATNPSTGNVNGGVCALNANTGKLAWRWDLTQVNGGLVSSNAASGPVVDGTNVILSYADTSNYHSGGLVALNAATGAVRWDIVGCSDHVTDYCDGGLGGTPAVADGGVFYAFGSSVHGYNAAFCRVDEATGAQTWCQYFASYASTMGAAVAGKKVFLGAGNADYATTTLYALDEATGAIVWSRSVAGWNDTETPAVAGGLAYFVTGDYLYAVNAGTGKVVWSYAPNGAAGTVVGGVSVANGVVYALCSGAQTCAFNARTGAVLLSTGDRYALNNYVPTVVNGTVFESCDSNSVCAYAP